MARSAASQHAAWKDHLLLVSLILAVGVTRPLLSEEEPPVNGRVIQGTVVDQEGHPVARAKLYTGSQ